MCEDHTPPHAPPPVLHEVEVKQPIPLETVDSVEITTLMDNVTDVFMPDQGQPAGTGHRAAPRRAR
jgi:hypothetical protein